MSKIFMASDTEEKKIGMKADNTIYNSTPILINNDEDMNSALVSENKNKIYKFIGTNSTVFNYGDLYIIEEVI